MAYALVGSRIEQYDVDSLVEYPNRYNTDLIMVTWVDLKGRKHTYPKDKFIKGSLEDLQILLEAKRVVLDELYIISKIQFPDLNSDESYILKLLVEDGYLPYEINIDLIRNTLKGVTLMRPYCVSFDDAYFEYMH